MRTWLLALVTLSADAVVLISGVRPPWLMLTTAILNGLLIWRLGITAVRSFSSPSAAQPPRAEPEDVEDLDVFLVCGECGTELKVSRLGELQVPRHCGERMHVLRR